MSKGSKAKDFKAKDRKAKNKKFRRLFIWAIIPILIVVVLAGAYISRLYWYGEQNISFEQLIENAVSIKDFDAKNGIITSLGDDPWIEYGTSSRRVQTIDINVNYLSDDYTKSELFVTHTDNSMRMYTFVLEEGKNVIDLQLDRENIKSLRFDLLTGTGQQIGISGIDINSPDSLSRALSSDYIYILSVIAVLGDKLLPCLLCIAAVWLLIKKCDGVHIKDRVLRIGAVCAAFAAVYVLYCFVGVNTFMQEKIVSFEELTSYGIRLNQFDMDGNTLVSKTIDPWVTYYDNDANTVRTVSINVSSLSNDETGAQLFVFFDEDSYDIIDFTLKEGSNVITLPQYLDRIEYFRFDLTDKAGIKIGIDNVVFNSKAVIGSFLAEEGISLCLRVFFALALIFIAAGSVAFGKRFRRDKAYGKPVQLMAGLIPAAALFFIYISARINVFPVLLAVALAGFFTGKFSHIPISARNYGSSRLYGFIFAVFAVMAYIILPKLEYVQFICSDDSDFMLRLFLMGICGLAMVDMAALNTIKDDYNPVNYRLGISTAREWLFGMAAIIVMTGAIEVLCAMHFRNVDIYEAIYSFFRSDTFYLSLLLFACIYLLPKYIFGGIVGRVVGIILFLFYFIGNFVKLRYHDTVFLPMDILQIGDFFAIVDVYVPLWLLWILLFVLLGVFFALMYIFRKKLVIFKANLWVAAVLVFMIVSLTEALENNKFLDLGVDTNLEWQGSEVCVNEFGELAYTYLKFGELSDMYPRADKNYDREKMLELNEEFKKLTSSETTQVKPDVILIMEESMFDVQKVPEVDFSENITENMRRYSVGDVISPKYGGGTASVEFEALTGFSNFFFLDNIVPYVTYWNNEEDEIPSIAKEFNNNGYSTTAIHPNTAELYNRAVVYQCMGFDEFISKDEMDFSPSNLTDDGYFKDEALADVIEERLDAAQDPSFIFAITIENHTLYENKYSNTEVKLSSDKLSESELSELEQYSQGVLSADRFIKKMIDYVDNAERPTILYIWGDHLPALSAFNTLGFINDKYNKYTTAIIAYSNYKDIEIGCEYITPNQIAPQVLRDAGIEYSSYFDYIYSLREDYPVIQKEFGINPEDEAIKTYELIQYDLLFGDEYLLESP